MAASPANASWLQARASSGTMARRACTGARRELCAGDGDREVRLAGGVSELRAAVAPIVPRGAPTPTSCGEAATGSSRCSAPAPLSHPFVSFASLAHASCDRRFGCAGLARVLCMGGSSGGTMRGGGHAGCFKPSPFLFFSLLPSLLWPCSSSRLWRLWLQASGCGGTRAMGVALQAPVAEWLWANIVGRRLQAVEFFSHAITIHLM